MGQTEIPSIITCVILKPHVTVLIGSQCKTHWPEIRESSDAEISLALMLNIADRTIYNLLHGLVTIPPGLSGAGEDDRKSALTSSIQRLIIRSDNRFITSGHG